MRLHLSILALLVAAACQEPAPEEAPEAPATVRPHVVLVIADDLGYADLGFTGALDIDTPRLDALAARGVVCTDAHVCASVCAPSRAGLMTGRYPQRFGFECNLAGVGGLPEGTRTLAHGLSDVGYQTVLVGKWHLGAQEHQHPLNVGFDHFTGLIAGSRSYFPQVANPPGAERRIERDRVLVPEGDFEYLTDFLADEAVRFVHQRNPDRPLFLVLSATAPHGPMHGRADLLESYADRIVGDRRRTYASMVTALDEGVGRVVDALESEGMLEDTLLAFLSDNGGATGNASDNGPWRGMKGSKWEGGHRVPLLLHWPAAFEPGSYSGLVSSLDLAATALAVAGAPVPADPPLDGMDLVPFLRGELEVPPHDMLFWRRDVAAAVREGDIKLVRIREPDGSYRPPVVVDIAANPDESLDLAASRPDLVRRLRSLLEDWESELRDPLWIEGERWQNNQRYKHRMDVIGRDAERRLP